MSGRQLAGWGYGIFWVSLLCETVNAVLSALSTAPLASPVFWVGQALTFSLFFTGIGMLMGIRHRPW